MVISYTQKHGCILFTNSFITCHKIDFEDSTITTIRSISQSTVDEKDIGRSSFNNYHAFNWM